jgi:hypothetical protein
MRIRLVVAVAALSSLSFASRATAATPAATSAPAAAQDAARLLVPRETWAAGVQQLAAVVQRNLEGHPGSKLQYPSDLQSKVRAEVEAALPYEALVGMHAKELAGTYTEAELKELIAFFGAPVGKKWLQVQPKASEAVALETQRRVEQKMPEIMTKMGQLAQPPASSPHKAGAPASSPHKAGEPGKKSPH